MNLRRQFRDRTSIFFVIVFPMMLILLLGAAFGGGFTPVMGVVDREIGPLGMELVGILDDTEDVDVRRYSSEGDLVNAVERGRIEAGLVVPTGFDAALRRGEDVKLRFFGRPGSLAQQLRTTVEAAVEQQSMRIRVARFAESQGVAEGDALDRAGRVASAVTGVQVKSTSVGSKLFEGETGTFDQGASTQLLLFVFLNSLTGAIGLIETRRLGMSRRMLSTPTATRTILVGEALGRWSIALVQGLIIVLGSALIFGVGWGDPAGVALVLIVFSLVGAGAGMLLGSVLNNDQQAIPVALLLGLGLAALGGSMIPLEIFPDTMRTFAHATPHAWGNDAFSQLVQRNGQVVDILRELAVLAAFAVVLFSVATWRLRKVITT